MNKKRFIIFGFDGGTWELINPFIRENILPSFKYMMDEGSCGKLISTLPPWTVPGWISALTGVNPGKHGCFDFFNNVNYEKKIISSKQIKSPPIWRILTRQNKISIIVNAPATYPPEKIKGAMVSGMLTPSLEKEFTYPAGIKKMLLEKGYRIGVELEAGARSNKARSYALTNNKKKINKLLNEFNEIEKKRSELTLSLMEKYRDWDFVFILFESGDRLQHYFWSEDTKWVLKEHYRIMDNILGTFLKKIDKDTTLAVISDHGFTKVKKKIYINNMLKMSGLLKPVNKKNQSSFFIENGRKAAVLLAGLGFPVEKILNWTPVFKLYSKLWKPEIDFSKSPAFMLNETSQGIWINRISKFQNGNVSYKDYENLIERIVNIINGIKDTETSTNPVKAYKSREIYFGGCTAGAPDIILQVEKGYSLEPTVTEDETVIRKVLPGEKNADHAIDGIFLHKNHEKGSGLLKDPVYLYDIVPLILKSMNLNTDYNFDGYPPF